MLAKGVVGKDPGGAKDRAEEPKEAFDSPHVSCAPGLETGSEDDNNNSDDDDNNS